MHLTAKANVAKDEVQKGIKRVRLNAPTLIGVEDRTLHCIRLLKLM